MKKMHVELAQRYVSAGHAIQTGVAMEHERGSHDGEPKHLRTGINLTKTDHAGLAKLLIDKGVITAEEYYLAIVEAAEAEVVEYETRLSEATGADIHLG